jgi:hypothetical protein
MTTHTDTSERGLERLICTALAGHPCEPPGNGSVGKTVEDDPEFDVKKAQKKLRRFVDARDDLGVER